MIARRRNSRALLPALVLLASVTAVLPAIAAHFIGTVEAGIDRAGSDYKNVALDRANPAACATLCANDNNCRAYTYVKPNMQGPKARCYLKKAVPAAVARDCCTSGVKKNAFVVVTEETGSDRPGGNYRDFALEAAQPALCRNQCDSEAQCKAYAYVKPGLQGPKARCWLKSTIPPRSANACCTSGAKLSSATLLTVEGQRNRAGSDLRSFRLTHPDVDICRAACGADTNCKAYTYVKPGVQGPDARCWLKSAVPAAVASDCCTSGTRITKEVDPQSAAGGTGQGWQALATKVDGLVEELMKKKLPGMTVAVILDGRLVLTRGYGIAGYSFQPGVTMMIRMQPHMRSRIGSVTKAVVTGPAGFALMKSKGIDPNTQTLYGPNGLFGTKYDADIEVGFRRHTPVVDIAISPEDRVFAWYVNGTFSEGSSDNLARHSAPKQYTLPPGKTPTDVRGIAIDQIGQVWTWYSDRTRSIGTPDRLDSIVGLSQKDSVKLPSGKTMDHIVGIDFAKKNPRVYVWYEDGTVSSGLPFELGKDGAPKPFTTSAQTSYDIRGVGIAKNDHVYAWFANGTASSGMSTRLDRYVKPYHYSMPATPWSAAMRDWYRKITIQNLLDHRAGFTRSGDTEGAKKLFGTNPTYESVHRHFLRTRRLLSQPGSTYSYSNHGFGLWTLLIERMSGEAYYPYVRDRYLKPLGLHQSVLPERSTPDALDAANFSFDASGKAVPIAYEQWGLGLAAGGFRASARDLVRLMKDLEARFTQAELDSMGWGKSSRGKLEHSGLTDGGTAYVVMFPQGYTSVSGVNLSRIHIAVVTNIRTESNELESLANKIALEVRGSNVPGNYDLWKP
jgi:CubicO group peptidase (beta-lactamase class C family)